jgi:signal transduction histidine kinase
MAAGEEAKAADTPGAALRARFGVPELLNTVCHDVRATLSVTSGSTTELGSGDYGSLTDAQRQLIGIIQRGNGRLARLAGSLMHLADLWDEALELRPTRADLTVLVRQCADDLGRQDPSSRAGFVLRQPQGPVNLWLDIERFRHVLVSVLAMAMAVAQAHVIVSLGESDDRVELTVEDDGPERKRCSAAEGVKRVSSTELALAVCEGLVKAHGGTLDMQTPTQPQGGTRVRICLPRHTTLETPNGSA